MIFIFVIIWTILIILILQWYMKRRWIIKCLEKFPGPPPLPIVGNALEMNSTTVVLSKALEHSKKYGGIVKLYVGPTPSLLVITDPDMLEFLLSSQDIITKSFHYKYWTNWLGSGLLTATGDKWRKHRKILTPAFHFKILEEFIPAFEANTKVLIKKLESEIGKSSTDVYPYVKLCLLDTICESAMGSTVNAQKSSESQYIKGVQFMCQMLNIRMFSTFMQHNSIYFFTRVCRKEKECVKYLHNYTNSVIKRRKETFQNFVKESTMDDNLGIKRRFAFLDLMLQENVKSPTFTIEHVREEVDTVMFAGHDTTSSAISFAIHCLAENQDIQEKVVEELRQIFYDDKFRPHTKNDFYEMKYLECVIKETLRLYPSAPLFLRNVDEDFEYDGATIPKGITLMFNPYVTHRNPKWFPEPEKFDPERFTLENSKGRHPFAYIPFSAGPRNCIGQKYAMMNIKANLSMLLRHFKFLPTVPKHQLTLAAESIIVSKTGIRVRIEKREF